MSMSMSRKHYTAIAAVLADRPKTNEVISIAAGIATVLKEDNPRFDVDRFMSAAGIASVHYHYSMFGGEITV